ncbi:response regulator [Sphingomonas montanisoli]|uniref:Response regulator n=1 Tax=Sphingomonas montanisoli TaxID=2606412 RepID=A0A5D9C6U2_9SPHN|nr:response regulator [Sphingomonas montanisoli]TZG27399.1 response regulator [Sphingomonas montanisoli]
MLFGRRERKYRRLLIVEDEPLVAFDTEHFLTDCGYVVIATVDNADDALAAIAEGGIDLILSDVTLSRASSGRDVALAAKAAGVPLLFVTARCPVDAPQIAIGCLAKPYKQRDLGLTLEAVEAKLGGASVPKRLPTGLSLY